MNNLMTLSNEELEIRLKEFVTKEKFLLHIILDHIKEFDKRKLYLERAYSSLYAYLVQELGYSGTAAIRRQEAARLLIEIPELGQKIRQGSVNLSQIGELAKAIKKKEQLNYQKTKNKMSARISTLEKIDLLTRIENKTVPETQSIVSKTLDLPIQFHDKITVQGNDSIRLELTLTQEQYLQLLKCKDQAAHSLEQQGKDFSWGTVLEHLADQYIKKYSQPTTRNNHNQKKSSIQPEIQPEADAQEKSAMYKNQDITPKLRPEILKRDISCQYKDPDSGKVCGSTFRLQVDHKVPKWTQNYNMDHHIHQSSNLQVLCANHNKYKYQKECHIH